MLAVLAVASLAWAAWLSLTSGLDTHIGSVHLTSRDAMPSLVVGLLALLGVVALGDRERIRARLDTACVHVDPRAAAAAIAVGSAVIAGAYATAAATGSDSYGYVSQANALLAQGSPLLAAPGIDTPPWPGAPATLAPLGYHAIQQGGTYVLAPTYAPGVPLLMAAAKRALGEEGLFVIHPIAGAVLVYLTFVLGRLLYSPGVGLVAAWLVATSTIFLAADVWPMSDVPAAACWTGVFFLLQRRRRGDVVGAGLIATMAIAIRPNLVLLAIACAAHVVIAAVRDANARRALAMYALAASPAPIAIAWTNRAWYGDATHLGYGTASQFLSWSRVLPNIGHYSGWLLETQAPLLAAIVVAVILAARLRAPARSGAVISALAVSASLLVVYLPFLEFDDSSYLRFFLPAWPLVAIAAASLFVALARSPRPLVAVTAAWLVVAAGLVDWRVAGRRGVFTAWRGERRAVLLGQRVRDLTDPHSVIFSVIYSGSVRYYGGRATIRYDLLDAAWLDRAVQWLSDHGAHPYLLAERSEMAEWRARFSNQTSTTLLDRPPVLAVSGASPAFLFDLAPASDKATTITLPDSALDARALRAAPPAPPPSLSWR